MISFWSKIGKFDSLKRDVEKLSTFHFSTTKDEIASRLRPQRKNKTHAHPSNGKSLAEPEYLASNGSKSLREPCRSMCSICPLGRFAPLSQRLKPTDFGAVRETGWHGRPLRLQPTSSRGDTDPGTLSSRRRRGVKGKSDTPSLGYARPRVRAQGGVGVRLLSWTCTGRSAGICVAEMG